MNASLDRRSLTERFGLYRNTKSGWIAGVCAGIADRLGVKIFWVRIAFVLLACAVFHAIPAILLYIVCVLATAPRSVDFGYAASPYPAGSPGYFADRFYGAGGVTAARPYQSSGPVPDARAARGDLSDIAARFAALDARLNHIEAAVMSDEISLRRKFRDLGG